MVSASSGEQATSPWLPVLTASRNREIDDSRGYVIYVAAEQVPNAMYRAWAEIMKDGKRVERSGLVGPRFAQAGAAEQLVERDRRQTGEEEEQSAELSAERTGREIELANVSDVGGRGAGPRRAFFVEAAGQADEALGGQAGGLSRLKSCVADIVAPAVPGGAGGEAGHRGIGCAHIGHQPGVGKLRHVNLAATKISRD